MRNKEEKFLKQLDMVMYIVAIIPFVTGFLKSIVSFKEAGDFLISLKFLVVGGLATLILAFGVWASSTLRVYFRKLVI